MAHQPGEMAQDFTLRDTEGRGHALAEARVRGPTVLFYLRANEVCRDQAPLVERLWRAYPQAMFSCWAVSLDNAPMTRSFGLAAKLSFPLLVDLAGEAARALAVASGEVPALFLLDEEGVVLNAIVGPLAGEINEVSRELAGRLAQPDVDIAPRSSGG